MCIFYKLRNDDELIKFVCVYLGFRSCFKLMDNIQLMIDLNRD